MPVAGYDHAYGCAVAGGYVYRGGSIPSLAGTYLFADWCSGRIWELRREGGRWTPRPLLDTALSVSSFGEGEDGRLHVLDYRSGSLFRLDGRPPAWTIMYGFNRVLSLILLAALSGTLTLLSLGVAVARRAGIIRSLLSPEGRYDPSVAGIVIGTAVGALAAAGLESAVGSMLQVDQKRLAAALGMVVIAAVLATGGSLFRTARWVKALVPVVAAIPLIADSAGRTYARLPLVGGVEIGIAYHLVLVPLALVLVANATRTSTGADRADIWMALVSLGTLILIAAVIRASTSGVLLLAGTGGLVAGLFVAWTQGSVRLSDSARLLIGLILVATALLGKMEIGLLVAVPYLLHLGLQVLNRLRMRGRAGWNPSTVLPAPMLIVAEVVLGFTAVMLYTYVLH